MFKRKCKLKSYENAWRIGMVEVEVGASLCVFGGEAAVAVDARTRNAGARAAD